MAEEILRILSPLGIATSDIKPKLSFSDADKGYIQGLLNKEGIMENDFLICIHPDGMYETQYWRNDGYGKFTQHLIRKYGAKVIFAGSQGERNIVFGKDLLCSPCNFGSCYGGDFACMREIKPEEVTDDVDSQLQFTGRQLLKEDAT